MFNARQQSLKRVCRNDPIRADRGRRSTFKFTVK